MIEVGPCGIFAIGKPVGGIIAPTKHDGVPRMARYNPAKNGESSRERSARIHELLGSGAPFGPADFEQFSSLRDGEPDRASS